MQEKEQKKKASKTPVKSSELKKLDREIMFADYVDGMSLKDISSKHDIPYRTLIRHSQEDNWKDRKKLALQGVKETGLLSKDVLQEEAITKTLRVLHKVASDTEKGLFSSNDNLVRTNVKTLVDAIDKLVRLKMHVASGGVQKSEHRVKNETINWNELIEASVKAKKEGKEFDEKEFLKNVIDIEEKK